MSRVLVIGDTHAPCMLEGYIPFLKSVKRRYKCDTIVHIGDLVDWAALSYHEKLPHLKNPNMEFKAALKQVRKLYKAFPDCTWLLGNHDTLTERQATTIGLPSCALKEYGDLWEVPNWDVVPRFDSVIIDGVLYQHGDRGKGGDMAAMKNAKIEFRSVVQGHHHTQGGCWYTANQRPTHEGGRVFGLQTGCGVDHKLAAMAYGKKYSQKPLIGCGVVIDGIRAYFEPMEL